MWRPRGGPHDPLDTRPHVLPLRPRRYERRTRTARVRRAARAVAAGPAGRPGGDRPGTGLLVLRPDRLDDGDAERRRRAAPLRLERMQRGAVPIRGTPARRAPLPD